MFHAVRSRRFAINASSSAGDDGESAFSGSLRKNQKPEGVQPNGSGAGGLPTQDGKFVIGGNVSEAEWRTLDKKVSKTSFLQPPARGIQTL